MTTTVVITRQRDYDEVFSSQIEVPDSLRPGLLWIQAHCSLDEPTVVMLADLVAVWHVPEEVIMAGLRNLQRTGFFSLVEEDN